jgi:hypothetical protein
MINPADALYDLHSGNKRLENFALDHMQLRAPAEFTFKLVKGGLKIIFPKERSSKFQVIQLAAKPLGIDEWRAEDFKRPCRAAPFGDVCAF